MATLLWPASGVSGVVFNGHPHWADPQKAYENYGDSEYAYVDGSGDGTAADFFTFDDVTAADIPDGSTINSVAYVSRGIADGAWFTKRCIDGVPLGSYDANWSGISVPFPEAADLAVLRAASDHVSVLVDYNDAGGGLTAVWLVIDYYTPVLPVAAFDADHVTVPEPTTIHFRNLSTGYDSLEWDFGDGSDPSTEERPSHTFADDSTVTLTATNADGSDEATMDIRVGTPSHKGPTLGPPAWAFRIWPHLEPKGRH